MKKLEATKQVAEAYRQMGLNFAEVSGSFDRAAKSLATFAQVAERLKIADQAE